jgi:hypothetical protein
MASNGRAFRASYWGFGSDVIDPQPAVAIKAQPALEEFYHLRACTLDVELIQHFCLLERSIETSFGARHAELARNGTVVGYGDLGNDVSLYGFAMGAFELSGTGFTTSIGARNPLFDRVCECDGKCTCATSGWHWFWNLRGSVMWADATASALTDANAFTKNVAVASAYSRDKAYASRDHSETLAIGEMRLGLEYQRCLQCLPATVFFRSAVEYQHWSTGDLTATSSSYAFLRGGSPEFGGRVDASANAYKGQLDLFGIALGAGLTY